MNKETPSPELNKAKEKRAQALLRYLLSVYGLKELERLKKEYYQSIN
jgi:hypothetical protein